MKYGLYIDTLLVGYEHQVQLFQKACHPEEVPGVGQLPESAAEAELIAVRRRERRDERVVKFRHARHLNDVERLHPIILEVMLQPFSVINLDENTRLLIVVIEQKLRR